ncbi:MAG: cytochrome b/b6 domain-containing protein [Candidatus Marinimicrobia bacterium]|nr:cytochrome b/b6 domain-containing protein [Candidatus Neomarinimicrobiota bacterium]MBL7046333.1 cytochrome b/b6 domain-containing protein [Candidatus Neomarinimicrobiota bacterium]
MRSNILTFYMVILAVGLLNTIFSQDDDFEYIDSDACIDCHETSEHETDFEQDLSHSIHSELECLNCHQDKDTTPHKEDIGFTVGCKGCRACHEEASDEYQAHGRAAIGTCKDMPQCMDCHGDHDILPSTVKLSKTHPVNLPSTCGNCHENLDITKKYDILIDHPIEIYESSVHGNATKGGIYVAATCNDCHSTGGSAHKILSPGEGESSINHFNIPKTCGKCHKSVENDFWEGIHGKLVARGETDAPVCTHCHGEHGIISPDDPRSPVSRSKVAEQTCSPCHESAVLNVKYGLTGGRLTTFIDSYHGLKSKAGDMRVANCASCHGVHRILPSSDSTSTIHEKNLQETCGDCHPGISEKMAQSSIHGVGGEGLRTTAADVVANIYIIAIVVIIGSMVLHWLIDLTRQIQLVFRKRPQIRRMRAHEIWQHAFLTVSFIVLVLSGFALRYSDGWVARLFFGWERGFELRGIIHRVAAGVFIFTVLWHTVFIVATKRGRQYLKDMLPYMLDFRQFWQRIMFNLGRRNTSPRFRRFSYIEKAEYWALVWGTVVMIITGFLLWFDNWWIQFLPKGALDVALVIHFYEAWLATLAIFIWHLYSTVFHPHVYPMNPSWLTGTMPEDMYEHEHPEHLEEAKREEAELVQQRQEKMSRIEKMELEENNDKDDKRRKHLH